MHEIEEGLFLGNIHGAENLKLLEQHNIKAIVRCVNQGFYTQTPFEQMNYHYVPIEDSWGADIASHVPEAVRFIHRNRAEGNNVLVHCAAGVSRSASITIAYLMAKYQNGYDQTLYLVRSKRSCVCPNPGFVRQLRQLSLKDLASYLELN